MKDDLIIHVVGNKLDLASTHRVIPLKRTQEYISRILGNDYAVHEVSAKDDKGIEELFLQITRALVDRRNNRECRQSLHTNSVYVGSPEESQQTTDTTCCNS
ncbi:10668_t:CDS:2 [Paraglomus brasilianum]|uniref:10668_t:CDS:1 n=1 Tax=Paraglomus brasilianum TaxID=144538 RepID=A0A9N9B2I8_9GLOM|nr:10668_t:CDS:2 [Paraglomus brasilianum]